MFLRFRLNRDENTYENPLQLVDHGAPMFCGSHYYMGKRFTVVSIEVTVDELSTVSSETYRMRDICLISFTRDGEDWTGEQISCNEELGIEEDLLN